MAEKGLTDLNVFKREVDEKKSGELEMGSDPRQYIPFSKEKAIQLLEKHPMNVRAVARALGVNRATVYWHIKHDPDFAAKVKEIREGHCDDLEEVLYSRGLRDDNFTFNDRIAYLRAHRAELYNPTKRIIVEGYKMAGGEREKRIGAVDGAIDAEIVKTYQDRKQMQEAKQIKQEDVRRGAGGE